MFCIQFQWDGTIVRWTFNKTEIDSDSEEGATIYSQGRDGEGSESSGLRRSQRLADQRRKHVRENDIC